MAEASESLSPDDWVKLAQWVRNEYAERKEKRRDREKLCKEVDRQIAMLPRPFFPEEHMPKWYPSVELPGQFNALEVNAADVRRLLFPRSGTWFKASGAITDEYRDRWDSQRLKSAMVGKVPLEMLLDQETVDVLVRQVLEHYHRMYDFEASIGHATSEALKYGTGIVRVKKVRAARSAHEYRGQWSDQTVGPKVIPCSWWNTYLDDSWSALLHEGEVIGPTVIRWIGSQPLEDLKAAIELGGGDEGWRMGQVDRLIGKTGEDDKKGRVQLLECEGDVLVPQNQAKSIYLPNVILTVAMGTGGVDVVRFKKNPMPFRSYVAFQYFKHDSRHAYGDSPLIKGVPLQEIASFAVNDFLASSRLSVRPPIAYDRNDPNLTVTGGPEIYPGAMWPTEAPDAVKEIKVGEPAASLNAALAFIKQHEDTTGSTEARRGQRLKSHTTAFAADVEASQGVSRTDDFVTDTLAGPLPTVLHMEYEIARDSMKSPQYIRISAEGIDGWVKVSRQDLPDMVEFDCTGAEGNIEQAARSKAFVEASAFVVTQLAPAAVQLGATPLTVNFDAIAREVYERADVHNSDKYVGAVAAVSQGAANESIIPGIAAGDAVGPDGAPAEALPPEEGLPPGGSDVGMGLPVGPV